MLRYELLKKGVPKEVAEAALEGYDDEENAYTAAYKIVPRISQLDYSNFSRILNARLARRGFGWSVIRKTTQRTWSELTNPLDGAVEGKA
jgi:SOS response regulatory protein OraA/RecX